MKASEVLRKAKESINTKNKWRHGGGLDLDDDGKLCALAALNVLDFYTEGRSYLLRAIDSRHPSQWCGPSVINFNDSATHAEVMEAFDRAIALAEKEEGCAGQATCGCVYHAEEGVPCEHDKQWATEQVNKLLSGVVNTAGQQREATQAK